MRKLKNRIGQIIAPYPNWATSVTESYEFSTTIITSNDGTEQRSAARLWPRVAVEFRADAVDGLAERVQADLHTWPDDGLFVLPVDWRKITLSADIVATDTVLSFTDDLPWWLVAGAKIVLDDGSTQEVGTVESVTSSTLTLTDGVSQDYDVGTKIKLAWDVRYASEVSLEAAVSPLKGGPIQLDVDPGSTPDWTLIDEPGLNHEGYEVFPFKPDWAERVQLSYENQREVVDFGRGLIGVTRFRDFTAQTESLLFTGLNQSDVDSILHFFLRKRGMQQPFWVPTHLKELRLAATATAGSTTIVVLGDAPQTFASDDVWTTVCVEWSDGALQYNRILGMGVADTVNTYFTVEDDWERDVTTATKISWASYSRFGADRLEIEWLTSEVAQMRIPFRALPNTWINEALAGPDNPYWEAYLENWSNWGADFSQPETWPFTEFDLEAIGFPLSLVDRSRAQVSAYFNGICEATGSLIWEYRIGVWFFRENGTEILGTSTSVSVSGTRVDGQTDPFTLTLPPVTLPVGTRIVRLRSAKFHSTVDGSESKSAWLIGRNWGTMYSGDNLLWP